MFHVLMLLIYPIFESPLSETDDITLQQLNVFSSPELKAQVSFSDRQLSVVCLSIRLSVRLLHFLLLPQNYWANFNQSRHKSSLDKLDSELYK
jgi:hypothetical protein